MVGSRAGEVSHISKSRSTPVKQSVACHHNVIGVPERELEPPSRAEDKGFLRLGVIGHEQILPPGRIRYLLLSTLRGY